MNDHRCMRDIPASDVVDIAERLLSGRRHEIEATAK
jgi:hypothetical protein